MAVLCLHGGKAWHPSKGLRVGSHNYALKNCRWPHKHTEGREVKRRRAKSLPSTALANELSHNTQGSIRTRTIDCVTSSV
jgi:hypothetical protein